MDDKKIDLIFSLHQDCESLIYLMKLKTKNVKYFDASEQVKFFEKEIKKARGFVRDDIEKNQGKKLDVFFKVYLSIKKDMQLILAQDTLPIKERV